MAVDWALTSESALAVDPSGSITSVGEAAALLQSFLTTCLQPISSLPWDSSANTRVEDEYEGSYFYAFADQDISQATRVDIQCELRRLARTPRFAPYIYDAELQQFIINDDGYTAHIVITLKDGTSASGSITIGG